MGTEASVFSFGFKGLPNGWKTLRQITFVTGENSSGKTSFLELLEILDSQEFNLFFSILGASEGNDDWFDVISKFGDGKTVTIGYIQTKRSDDPGGEFYGRLITFEKAKDDLVATKVTFIFEDTAIRLIRRGQKILAKQFSSKGGRLTLSRAAKLLEAAHLDTGPGNKQVFDPESEKTGKAGGGWFAASLNAILLFSKTPDKSRLEISKAFSTINRSPFLTFRYGPIRGETKKFYQHSTKRQFDASGAHFPHIFREIFSESSSQADAIKRFGAESGLFDNIQIKRISPGSGEEIFSILFEKMGRLFLGSELGYGVGQIIPIVTDLVYARNDATFLIQQPEVHLHPKAQAAFGSLLFESGKDRSFTVVETHSDFVIDRFRLEQAKGGRGPQAQILFFYFDKGESRPNFSTISIAEDGSLVGTPDEYREFFTLEEIEIFRTL